MSSAGISFGGMASGLDTQAIISALMAVERRPITALETKKTSLTKAKSMLGDFSALIDKLNDAAKAVKTTSNFLNMKATVEGTDYLGASASSSALPGTYQIKINKLAQAQVNASTGVASTTTAIDNTGSGSPDLALTVNGQLFMVTPTGTSMQDIANAINDANAVSDFGVRAEIMNTGNASNPYQLVLRSETTGLDGDFTIAVDAPNTPPTAYETFISGLNSNVRTQAQNSEIEINGIQVTRSSNQVTDAIAGVTLDLKATTPLDPTSTSTPQAHTSTTLTIGTDASATADKVKALVDAYNKVVDFVETQNVVDKSGKASSPLFGDSTLRSVRSTLRSVIGGQVDTGNIAYQMLAQAGVTSDTKGKLTFNQSKFEEALVTDPDAVSKLFAKASGTGVSGGLAVQLVDRIDVFSDSIDGIFKARNDGFDATIKRTQTQIDQGEARLTRYEAQLKQTYSNLESLLSRLQSQGSSLSSIR